jgi:AAA15 family ATPase/GTPase
MILGLKFSNYYSFYEPVEISFEVGKKPSASFYDIALDDERRVNKVIAVVGANGSGKTHFLRPLAFLSWFVGSSFLKAKPDSQIPFKAHALHEDEPSEIELRFNLLNGVEYKYHVILLKNDVVLEALYKKTSQQYSYIFVRERQDDGTYSVKKKDKDFPFKKSEAEKIKANSSLLSAASVYGTREIYPVVNFFNYITSNITVFGRANYSQSHLKTAAKFLYFNQELKAQVNNIMLELDLGLAEIDIVEYQQNLSEENTESEYIPWGIHRTTNGEFKLPFYDESSGTQSAFVLLCRLLSALSKGSIAVIDELDNDLHPHMLPKILDLFKFEHTNPYHAQLIFSCHTPEILDALQKHQVYLVEKNDLHSEAWRLDEVVGIRADDNLYAKYQAGALGAIPHL